MQLPLHAHIEDFSVRNNCLVIEDQTITTIAENIGSTPYYAYSRSLIDRRITKLRAALPQDIDIHFAMKANPMPAVVNHIANQVDGLDIASQGELEIALKSGMSNDHISFAGPGKRTEELKAAVAAGIVVNVESPNELVTLLAIGAQTGVRPKLAIRVNPDFELKSSGMRMSGGPKPFGIDSEKVPALLRNLHDKNIDFRGFHIFTGSQNLNPEAICEAQLKSLELAIKLSTDAPCMPREINIGGGFGIPYFPGDKPLDLAPIGTNLTNLVAKLAATGSTAKIAIELGRYIVGEAGIYVTRIVDRKESRGHIFLVTDGGLNHHLSVSGNFGQVLRKNYPVLIGNKALSGPEETVSVVGPLCTPLDLLGSKMNLAHADIGDLVVVFQSGAYGLTASPVNFLSHPPPQEILL